MRCHTLYADPPWPEHGGGKSKRGADRHYDLLSIQEITNLGIQVRDLIEDDCHLYLWVTNNYLPAGLQVMAAWGFRYVTKITWVKDGIGLGQYYRGATEDCLFGVRGRLPYREHNGKRAQGRTVIFGRRAGHSQKPAEMRSIIEKVSHPPYLELFAREHHPGWEVWGYEAPTQLITEGKLL